MSRFSKPVRYSSTAAFWPETPIMRARRRRVGDHVDAGRRWPCPESGRTSVVSTLTAVVLPAPLGPSTPSTVPSGTLRSSPSSAAHLAVAS